jgi:uncharacterized protein (DUF2141 family)
MNQPIMIRHLKFLAIVIILSVAGATSVVAQSTNVLRVKLDGFRSNNGKARCGLYNDSDPAAFPKDDKKGIRPDHPGSISNASSELDFSGIPPGKYALVCYHDENDNHKFDKNMLGMPKEGYCFSNNIMPTLAAPNFSQCEFDYKGGDQLVSMTMIY